MMRQRGSRYGQVNRQLEELLQYLMQMDVMKKRHGFQMEQIGARERGYRGLEESRYKNQYNLLMQKLANEVSQLPRMDYWRQRIQQAELAGEDVSTLRSQAHKEIQDIVGTMFETASGQKITMPNLQKSIGFISEGLLEKVIVQGATTERAREERKLGREALGVRRAEIGAKLMVAQGKTASEQRDFWKDFIQENINYLEMQGVQGEDPSATILDMFKSGKKLSPLSPAQHGQALTYLTQIMARLGQGKMPTQGEINFMTKVRNTFQITAEAGAETPGAVGGLPSPVSGQFPSEVAAEDEALKARMIEIMTRLYQEEGGLSLEEARRKAIALAATIK